MQHLTKMFRMRSTLVVAVAIFGLLGAFLIAPNAADAADTGWLNPSWNSDVNSSVDHPERAYYRQ